MAKIQNKNLSTVAVTIDTWSDHFKCFYTFYNKIHASIENNRPKKIIINQLKDMFDNKAFDACIFVYTGPCSPDGGLLIESKDSGSEEIVFQDILQQWNKRASKQKHLLIILDCNYAGTWALDFHNNPDKIETISILCSCLENQKTFILSWACISLTI